MLNADSPLGFSRLHSLSHCLLARPILASCSATASLSSPQPLWSSSLLSCLHLPSRATEDRCTAATLCPRAMRTPRPSLTISSAPTLARLQASLVCSAALSPLLVPVVPLALPRPYAATKVTSMVLSLLAARLLTSVLNRPGWSNSLNPWTVSAFRSPIPWYTRHSLIPPLI